MDCGVIFRRGRRLRHSIVPTSSRRCAVSRSSLNSGPNGQPSASQPCQNQTISSSLSQRSRGRSFVGRSSPRQGDVVMSPRFSAQLNSFRNRASTRFACTFAPLSAMAVISASTSLRVIALAALSPQAGFTSCSRMRFVSL
jgi:hypothetical protein